VEAVLEILKTCIPIIVGALIAVIPTMIEKRNERKNMQIEKQSQKKQELYAKLISLFGEVLTEQNNVKTIGILREHINLINIIGSSEVVQKLNEYLITWGNKGKEEQSKKYNDLLKAIRIDLGIDTKKNTNFPEVGLIDINLIK